LYEHQESGREVDSSYYMSKIFQSFQLSCFKLLVSLSDTVVKLQLHCWRRFSSNRVASQESWRCAAYHKFFVWKRKPHLKVRSCCKTTQLTVLS